MSTYTTYFKPLRPMVVTLLLLLSILQAHVSMAQGNVPNEQINAVMKAFTVAMHQNDRIPLDKKPYLQDTDKPTWRLLKETYFSNGSNPGDAAIAERIVGLMQNGTFSNGAVLRDSILSKVSNDSLKKKFELRLDSLDLDIESSQPTPDKVEASTNTFLKDKPAPLSDITLWSLIWKNLWVSFLLFAVCVGISVAIAVVLSVLAIKYFFLKESKEAQQQRLQERQAYIAREVRNALDQERGAFSRQIEQEVKKHLQLPDLDAKIEQAVKQAFAQQQPTPMPTPSPVMPPAVAVVEQPQEVINYYFPSYQPQQRGFIDQQKQSLPLRSTLFELKLGASRQDATYQIFSFNGDDKSVINCLSSSGFDFNGVLEMDHASEAVSQASRIVGQVPGKVSLRNGVWEITRKAKIKFS